MPVVIKLQTPSADGTKVRTSLDINVDYASADVLPAAIRFDRRIWERVGGANSVRYRPYTPPAAVDIEQDGKIVDV